MKMIFLLRHGEHQGTGDDPGLSVTGMVQAKALGSRIGRELDSISPLIWSSPAARAKETAEIVSNRLGVKKIVFEDKLWSDAKHEPDFEWLQSRVKDYFNWSGEAPLVIISHLEYVRFFPAILGYPQNNAGNGEGVILYEHELMQLK